MADETISEKCETLYNKLNSFVASVISRDVTPKIANLNTEVWGSDTQTGNSRIDTLNTNFNNLDSSITTMESDINNVESDVSNLQTSVNSLNTSIANLVKIQYIESGDKSINNSANVSVQHTVTACPSSYSWLWVQKDSYRATQTDVNLNGTTFSYKIYNFSGNNSSACYVRGWLVFYPSTWNI